jgi:hypothetical protein
MTPAEYNNFLARIRAAASIDEWNQVDRELRARPDANGDHVTRLVRELEQASAPTVGNTVARVVQQDVEAVNNGLDPEAEYEHQPWTPNQELVEFDPFAPPPGRLRKFQERMRNKGHSGVTFRFSDMMSDPDMEIALRETEAIRSMVKEWKAGFEELPHPSSMSQAYRLYRQQLDQLAEADEDEFSEEREERFQKMNAVLANALNDPTLDADELNALTTVLAWQRDGRAEDERWNQIGEMAMLMQDVENMLGEQRMRELADMATNGGMQDRMDAAMEIQAAMSTAAMQARSRRRRGEDGERRSRIAGR